MHSPKIIAEIGCNHKGDMAIAKEMIMTAATYCKADIVKFQKRCNKELFLIHILKILMVVLMVNIVNF